LLRAIGRARTGKRSMKLLMEQWRKFLIEEIDIEVEKSDQYMCPPPTQDIKLNTENRDAAIKAKHIKYGPLNILQPGDYYEKAAKHWDTNVEAAKESDCSNCVAFDISPRMDECMPGPVSDEEGRLGYCWMHHFKCHSARTCYTWAAGGPIDEDTVSHEWQDKSNFEEK
jgi:hypothetical protein